MTKPTGKYPYEIFGFSTGERVTKSKANDIKRQYCMFLKEECNKFRKSEPHVKIGSCCLGFKDKPVIVCPERFKVPVVFQTIEQTYFSGKKVKWISEVRLGDRGHIDFVAAVPNGNKDLDEFLCVEFQANGTIGTPWAAVDFWRKNHTLSGAPQTKYSFNWANEFIKTMTQQLLKKGTLLNKWGQRLVVVIQDLSMDYIIKQGKGICHHNPDLPIQFHPFNMKYMNGNWILVPSSTLYSASIEGIIQVLTSESSTTFNKNDFEQQILEKGEKQNVWDW